MALVAWVFAGCASDPTRAARPSGPPPSRPGASARPPRVTIGALSLPESKTLVANPDAVTEDAPAMPIDRDALREALRDELRRRGYPDVALEEERSAAARAEGRRVSAGDLGLVLETRLVRASLGRDEAADSFAFSFVTWFTLGWMSTWFDDHTYVLELQPTFTLTDPRRERTAQSVEAPAGRARHALDFHDRRGGLPFLATIALMPPFAFDSRPSDITRALAPASLREPVRRFDDWILATRERYVTGVRPGKVASGLSVELVSPKPGTVSDRATARVRVRAHARASVGISHLDVGGRTFKSLNGLSVEAEADLALSSAPLRVVVVTDDDEQHVAYEIWTTVERRE